MVNWRFYSNVAVADTLQVTGGGNLSTGGTSIYAGSGAPSGYPAQFPFTLSLEPGTANEELVSVTSGAGTVGSPWIITRAYDGTTAKTHVAGTTLVHKSSAGDFTTAATHYQQGSGSGVHGLPASAWATAVVSKIADTTLANSTTNVVTFSSIPNTSSHLLVVAQGRLTETSVQTDDVLMQVNGDTTAVYSFITQFNLYTGSTSQGTAQGISGTAFPAFRFTASSSGANVNAGGGFLLIPNYTGTAYNKTFYGISGGGNGTSNLMDLRIRTGVYNPTSQVAITSLSFATPANFYLIGTRFTLYGIS